MVAHGSELRRVHVLHLKRRAQEALDAKDYRLARDRYTQALHLCARHIDETTSGITTSTNVVPASSYHDKQEAKLLLCNRSLVELLAGRPQAALADAEASLVLAPTWSKGHWRVGKAAAALGCWPQAVQAYLCAWRLTTDAADKEACDQQLMAAVCSLTRQQLAEGILCSVGLKQPEEPPAPGCKAALPLCTAPGVQPPGAVQEELAATKRDTDARQQQQQQLQGSSQNHLGGKHDTSSSSSSSPSVITASRSRSSEGPTCSFASHAGALSKADADELVVVDGVAAPAAWWQQQQLSEAMYRLVKAGERVKALGGPVGRYQADYKRWLQAGRVPQEEELLLQAVLAGHVKQWGQALTTAAAAVQLLRTQAYHDEDLLCGLLIEAHTTLAQAATEAAAQDQPDGTPPHSSSGVNGSRATSTGVSSGSQSMGWHQAAACALLTALDLLPPVLDSPPRDSTARADGKRAQPGGLRQQGHVWGQLLNSSKYVQEQQQQLQHRLEAAQQQLSEQHQHQVYAWLAAGSDWLQLVSDSAATRASTSTGADSADAITPALTGRSVPSKDTASSSSAGDVRNDDSSEDCTSSSTSSNNQIPASSLALRMLGLSPAAGRPCHEALAVTMTWGPEADIQTLTGEQRLAAQTLLAAVVGVPVTYVVLKGVHSAPSGRLCLEAQLVYATEQQSRVTTLLSRCGQMRSAAAASSTAEMAALCLPCMPPAIQGAPASAVFALDLVGAAEEEFACLRLEACHVTAVKAPLVPRGVRDGKAVSTLAAQHSEQPVADDLADTVGRQQQQQQQQQNPKQLQVGLAHTSKCSAAASQPSTAVKPGAAYLTGEGEQPLVLTQAGGAAAAAAAAPDPPEVSLALALPYAHYQLVTADGRPVERADKHPFCFSRVMYSPQDCGVSDEVWVQLEGLGCRWRQSASEVKVLVTSIPPGLPAKLLQVTIQPYQVEVRHRVTGDVYLEGALERGVVPEDSCWVIEEDGMLLLLSKMNLELYESPWQHSASWWPRLFMDDPVQVAWDDYDKDYSDLPPAIAAAHAAVTARQERQNAEEAAEKERRKAVQAVVERALRERRERLSQLRSWFWSRPSCEVVEAV